MKSEKRALRKIAFAIVVISIVSFGLVFNTSTRYGRWLFWQDSDWGDVDRFAFRTVENDPQKVVPFSRSESESVRSYRIEGSSLTEYAQRHDSTALIVLQNNAIVLEEYFQGYDRESLQVTFSVTKSVVSMLVGIAIRDGLIDSVDDPISKYVGGLEPAIGELTLHQLLTMTSGISDAEAEWFGVPAPWCDQVKGYYDPDFRKLATTFTLTNTPGETFEYHDFNPILVALVLENTTHQNLADYLSAQVWKPAGMQYSARWSLDSERSALAKPESGLSIRAIDMARIGQIWLDNDSIIVPQSWRDQSTDSRDGQPGPQDKLISYADRASQDGSFNESLAEHIRSVRYGHYWWIVDRDGRKDFYANGRFGQFIYICTAADLVVVRCGPSQGGLDDFQFGNELFKLGSAVIANSQP